MIYSITNHIAHGLQSVDTPANKFTFYKTNFNMPVPNVFDSVYNPATMRYNGNATFLTETTTYDLTGFVPGYEICVGESVFDIENNSGSPVSGTAYMYQRWTAPTVLTDPASTLVKGPWATAFPYSLPAGYYTTVWYAINIGIRGSIGGDNGEVQTSATYHFRASLEEPLNSTVATAYTDVVFSNCPAVTQLGSTHEGYIWVEGNNLCYVNSYQWKHTIVGIDLGLGVVGAAGYLWLDTTDIINWIGTNGHNYVIPWLKKQFASFFTGSSTGTTYAGATKKGYFWVDNEFGNTHLAYIASDGYKYLCGAGDNPYA